jgi:glutathione S-transferase
MPVTIHGPALSTYVRTVRLTLEEKGVGYELKPLDLFGAGAHKQPEHLARHPFGLVPAFEHDGFALYETSAITRYIDRALPGTKLQPSDLKQLARMDQIVAVIDSYAYPSIISKLVIERIAPNLFGRPTDEAAIEAALPRIRQSLEALDGLAAGGEFLAGPELSLADLHLAPIFAYFTTTPDAAALLQGRDRLRAWWNAMEKRPALAKTAP